MSHALTCHRCFSNDTSPTEFYTLSLHDALPISDHVERQRHGELLDPLAATVGDEGVDQPVRERLDVRVELADGGGRSEEHTSELQSHSDLVCRLLLEKKNPD